MRNRLSRLTGSGFAIDIKVRHRAADTARAEYNISKDIPTAARNDRTWDNGGEACLYRLVDETL